MSAATIGPGAGARSTRGEEVRRFARLMYTLAITEWKLRFFGSALGYFWTLARPLMFFGVLYVVFSQVADIGSEIEYYPVYLLTGIVLFGFFSEGTGNAVTSLVERETLLRKVRFPRMVVPLSVVLTALFNLGMNLVAVVVFLLASGITPMVSWLEMPILVAILVALTTGLALLLAPAYVRFRDVSPIWDVVSQMLFYGSPIFYTVAMYGEFSEWMARTPLPALLTEMRHALIDPDAPSAAEAAGGAVWLLLPLGITGAILVAGILLFRRAAPRLAERL